MCDPISLVAAAGSLASAGVSYMGQQATMNAQQSANDDWVSYQRQQAREATQRDEVSRKRADVARTNTLDQLTPAQQAATQAADQARLETGMLGNQNPAGDQNIRLLAGAGAAGPGDAVTADISSRVTSAAREARDRIKALASLTAYGGGYGSMLNTGQRALTAGSQDIEMEANKRKGNTATLGTAQAVPVETFVQGQNIAGGLASSLAGLAGNAFGSKYRMG